MAKEKNDPFWVDESIVKSYKHGGHDVKYYCYYDDKPHTKRNIRRPTDFSTEEGSTSRGGVCFSDMLYMLKDNKNKKPKPNRAGYPLKWDKNVAVALSMIEKKDWVRCCKKYGFMPSYTPIAAAKDGIFVVDLEGITPALLYCYLSAFRCFREEVGCIRATLYLHKTKGMDFYAAFVLASTICVDSGGNIHHIGEFSRKYCMKEKANNLEMNLGDIASLRAFMKDPSKYDKRKLFSGGSWNCRSTIKNIFKGVTKKVTAKDLFQPKVVKAIYSDNPSKVIEEYKGA